MTTIEHPATRLSPWVFDVLLTVLAAALVLPPALHDEAGQPPASGVMIAVSMLAVAPLAVRRRQPLLVFGWLLLACVAIAIWDSRVLPGLALLVSLYTVAAERSRREAFVCAGLLEVASIAAVAFQPSRRDWWTNLIFLSGLVAAALAIGLYAATRRAYLAELHDRAERLERERDQQGALAAAAERARISREMHDIVAHHLTVIVALSDGAIAASAKSPARATEVMRDVSATGRRALADTRRLLGVLREPAAADGAQQPVPDLAELDLLIERIRAAGLATTFEVRGAASDVPAGIQLTVYRLVQEALTNTLKHAGPDAHAAVCLQYLPGELQVDIRDDGVGAAEPPPSGAGVGLVGMRERVRAYGGNVRSGPGENGGWQVAASLHLEDGERA